MGKVMSNAYEQYQTQQELGRIQRREHGADTQRDEAKVRHDAIMDWVDRAHVFGPFVVAAIFGWISPVPAEGFAFSVGGAVLMSGVAGGIAGIANALFGKFKKNVWYNTYHVCIRIGGAFLVVAGLANIEIGVIVTGLSLVALPTVWTKWARKVQANTAFSRMERRGHEQHAVPRLVE
jgi:hypothetical protein